METEAAEGGAGSVAEDRDRIKIEATTTVRGEKIRTLRFIVNQCGRLMKYGATMGWFLRMTS